LFSIS